MRAKFYIHIGVHKTGSKSIQYTLFNNREKLLERGINYLSIQPNHGPLFLSLFRHNPHRYVRNIMRNVDTPEKAAAHNDAIRRKLTQELSKNRSPKLVISGEGLSTAPDAMVGQLQDFLKPYADSFRIIVYVRDPYDYASSATLQGLKQGELLNEPTNALRIPIYKKWLLKYVEAFGRENVDIRVFDPKRFVGGDLVTDFLTAMGESEKLAKELKIERANQGLSHEAAVILSELNRVIPLRMEGHVNLQRVRKIDRFLDKIAGEKFSIGPALYSGHADLVVENVKWLQTMLGEPVFEKSQPRPASIPRWSDTTVESIKRLVTEMARRIRENQPQSRGRHGGKWRNASSGAQDLQPDIAIPAGLEWLREAVNPGTASQSETPPAAPQLDETTIRTLALFIHELAFAIRVAAQRGKSDGEGYSRVLRPFQRGARKQAARAELALAERKNGR
jgi:hypothetical protein